MTSFVYFPREKVKVGVKSAFEPSGPSGASLSRLPKRDLTRSISTPPRMQGFSAFLSLFSKNFLSML